MLRTSSYTIYVDVPGADDQTLLVHGYSGAYDRVSRQVAEYLLSLEAVALSAPLHGEWQSEPALRRGQTAAAPGDRTLEALQKRGYLTALSVEEEEGMFARMIKKMHQRAMQSGVGYIFMPTYQCNLRCPYCFQDHMRTDPAYAHLLTTMQPELLDRIFRAMPVIEAEHGVETGEGLKRRLGFYGGEPFLAVNRPLIEDIMRRATDLALTEFWAVSNATELYAYTDLLGPDGISSIQITLDGPPDEHDKRRIRADGSGSFEAIAQNIDLCLEREVSISVRMNLDRINIFEVPRLADYIVERGWNSYRSFSVYTAPIRAANDKTPFKTTFDTWQLDQAIDELREQHASMRVIGRPDDGMQARARGIFEHGSDALTTYKSGFCGAHSGMYIFDALGDIYACWERTGDARVRVGRVTEEGGVEMNAPLQKMWRSRTPASNPTCRKCRYAFQCGGGCAVLAEGKNGKFFSNFCDGFAERFRHSVGMAYLDHVNGVEAVESSRVCDL